MFVIKIFHYTSLTQKIKNKRKRNLHSHEMLTLYNEMFNGTLLNFMTFMHGEQ